MAETPSSAEVERELRALRARAYGPTPDIQDDPVALARLSELESARVARETVPTNANPAVDTARSATSTDPPSAPAADPAAMEAGLTKTSAGDPSPSAWRRATSTTASRILLVAATVVIGLAIIWTIDWTVDRLQSPRPDATLAPIGEEADDQILELIAVAPELDRSTLRGYQAYRGLEVWFAHHQDGLECLLAIERASDSIITANCAPPEAEVRLEVGGYPESAEIHYEDGLNPGSVIRFTPSGDMMDVFLFPASAAD